MNKCKKSQQLLVIQRIREYGYVDNFWAIQNYILRLGAIICRLRKDGYNIEGDYGCNLNSSSKTMRRNFYYFLPSKKKALSAEIK